MSRRPLYFCRNTNYIGSSYTESRDWEGKNPWEEISTCLTGARQVRVMKGVESLEEDLGTMGLYPLSQTKIPNHNRFGKQNCVDQDDSFYFHCIHKGRTLKNGKVSQVLGQSLFLTKEAWVLSRRILSSVMDSKFPSTKLLFIDHLLINYF